MKKEINNVYLAIKHIEILKSRLDNLEITHKIYTPDYASKA